MNTMRILNDPECAIEIFDSQKKHIGTRQSEPANQNKRICNIFVRMGRLKALTDGSNQ